MIKDLPGNALRVIRPVVVLDEGHKAVSDLAFRTLYGFNLEERIIHEVLSIWWMAGLCGERSPIIEHQNPDGVEARRLVHLDRHEPCGEREGQRHRTVTYRVATTLAVPFLSNAAAAYQTPSALN